MNKLVIVGSGGFGREVANVAVTPNYWNKIYFIDDAKLININVNDIIVIGNLKNLANHEGNVFLALRNIQGRNNNVQNLNNNKSVIFPNINHHSCNWVYNKYNRFDEGNYIDDSVLALLILQLKILI